MNKIFLIFPHQLFKDIYLLKEYDKVYLIEEVLFFTQYKFHKQKMVLHRASMKYYEKYLKENGILVEYIQAIDKISDVKELIKTFDISNTDSLHNYDVCDNWLDKKIKKTCHAMNLNYQQHTSPMFINNEADISSYFRDKSKFFQTDFYIQQRKKFSILLDEQQKPIGGKWSFDADNRLKYPKDKTPPYVTFPNLNEFYKEAIAYVNTHFAHHYGEINLKIVYPSTHSESDNWLIQFFETRWADFGQYEDAIVGDELVLNHSLLTPIMNIGLLTPMQLIEASLRYAEQHNIPFNSLEGFIRQIIGWREFIRGVYVVKGTEERTCNYWQFHKKIPTSFYNGTTGIEPIDTVIKKVLKTGYCHHIERLMILGNFMLLNEYHPDEVYQWFMEMFVDAYDWVMVPNVYGMSQFADGGLMSSKPYISGSSYVLKMSHYKKGAWCDTWDALFWEFMNKQRPFFSSNPRLGMLLKTYDKMSEDKKINYKLEVERFNKQYTSII
ncbi:MAG: cryptochrome/photolyase family protein [Bacteroidota bacterium]|nr:cryptochrome/photolyase family protein [Bacteroidota bacterium]